VAAGAGFLLAVLWFDLMFDVQVLGQGGPVLAEERLSSIAAYYARVTTAARPMNRLIARTVPRAVRLGTRVDAPERQSELARSTCREHLFCFVSIAALIALQLSFS
jgi:hypothetical protein